MDMDRFFHVTIDKSKGQVSGTLIGIKFINENTYEITIPFQSQSASLITYADHSYSTTAVAAEDFVQRYKVGEKCRCLLLDVRNK
jgi:hypothetical protein